MGYRLLGIVVWRAARWYQRRRYPDAPRNIAVGGVLAAGVAAGIVAASQRARSQ